MTVAIAAVRTTDGSEKYRSKGCHDQADLLEVLDHDRAELVVVAGAAVAPGEAEDVFQLLHRRAFQLPAVGCDDLEVMDSDFLPICVFPHDLLVASHFEQLRSTGIGTASGVAGDDDVSAGENLTAAWILEPVAWEVVVSESPDHLPFGVKINDSVSVSAADERVSVSVPDRREGPGVDLVFGVVRSGCVQLAQNPAVAGIVENGEVQQVRCEKSPVGKLTSHPRLHVVVLLLTGQREFQNHLAGSTDFEQSGIVPRLGDDERAIGCRLSAVDFALRAFPDQRFLAIRGDADDGSTITLRLAQRQNNRTVFQHVTVASSGWIRPARFSVSSHDIGLLATREKAVRDFLSNRCVANDAEKECRQ